MKVLWHIICTFLMQNTLVMWKFSKKRIQGIVSFSDWKGQFRQSRKAKTESLKTDDLIFKRILRGLRWVDPLLS
jgi:hypothetical protein